MSTKISTPPKTDLEQVFHEKYGAAGQLDWCPSLRKLFRYFDPDDWYEAVVKGQVTARARLLDIGCGSDIFPSNRALAAQLSSECSLLVGVNEDETVQENPYLHKSVNASTEDYQGETEFDLITLRMVAEHIADPDSAVSAIARLEKPEARVVVYTVNKYSPVPLITNFFPFRARHSVKKVSWRTEEKDIFPTAYSLNTRRELKHHMSKNELGEELFLRLDDCRSFARWRVLLFSELLVRTILHAVRIPYPEYCLPGVYQKQ